MPRGRVRGEGGCIAGHFTLWYRRPRWAIRIHLYSLMSQIRDTIRIHAPGDSEYICQIRPLLMSHDAAPCLPPHRFPSCAPPALTASLPASTASPLHHEPRLVIGTSLLSESESESHFSTRAPCSRRPAPCPAVDELPSLSALAWPPSCERSLGLPWA